MAELDEKLNQILSNPDAMAQIARLAQSLNADAPAPPGNVSSPAPPDTVSSPAPSGNTQSPAPPDTASSPAPPSPDNSPDASPDAGGVAQFLPLLRELGGDSDARRLLYALRPYLRPQKQEKVERALRFARLFRVGKRFLSQWEG